MILGWKSDFKCGFTVCPRSLDQFHIVTYNVNGPRLLEQTVAVATAPHLTNLRIWTITEKKSLYFDPEAQ